MRYLPALLTLIMLGGTLPAFGSSRFTAADSISMVRLADPDVSWSQYRAPQYKVAPDGRHFAFVTWSGNLASGRNEYTLYLYDMSEILNYLRAKETDFVAPKPAVIAQFETSSIWDAIDQVTWMPDSKRLAFIGRGANQIGQVYIYDVEDSRVEQLTTHSENIVRFAFSADSRVLVYGAHSQPDWAARNKYGYAVQAEHASSLAWTNPKDAVPDIRYHIVHLRQGVSHAVTSVLSRYPENIWISPSGRWAIVVSYLPRMPAGWSRYGFIQEMEMRAQVAHAVTRPAPGSSTVPLNNDVFGDWSVQARRLELIDTASGQAAPLLDAPLTGAPFIGVLWSRDDQQVLVGPSYMPLLGNADSVQPKKRESESILALDVNARSAEKVADVPQGKLLTDMQWGDGGRIVATFADHGAGFVRAWVKVANGRWRTAAVPQTTPQDRDIHFSVAQDLNTAPEIVAHDIHGNRSRVLTDLNPQLRLFDLGKAEVFNWSDTHGRSFQGGLVYPPAYDRSKRYPLVVQTYGFDPNSFLLDGAPGITSAYAARALVNAGLMVLQMPLREIEPRVNRDCSQWEECGENPRFLTMLEGALAELERRGLIDSDRVGLIGFSREGMHVHHAITFSTRRFAAAAICDSVAATPFTYALLYSFPFPGLLDMEAPTMMGAPLWGDGIKLWLDRSPAFHLDRIRTPLRIDAIGAGINGHWDTFVQLKRHLRPVELFHIPSDIHNLHTPLGRYASLQGNVDWFRFWLLGEEDETPAKTAQYERWHVLRSQHNYAREAEDSSRVSSPDTQGAVTSPIPSSLGSGGVLR